MSARPIRLLRSFATVGGWTMISRILGFARDVCIAAFLGSGPIAEAFFVAFRLPNLFRRFFAEGALNLSFVPIFAKKLEGDGPDTARRFLHEALSLLFVALLIFTAIAQIAMPWFVLALASGYEGERFDIAVTFSRIVFPYILFISLAALFSGVLNSFGHFVAAAAAPVLLNVILIAAMLGAWSLDLDIGMALAWGASVAGVAQLFLVWAACRKLGMAIWPGRPRLTPDARRLIRVGIPAALAGGVMQINVLVGTQVASYFEGAVGWLWYADRIYQLPFGVVGVAIGVVLLPELSRRFRAGDGAGTASAMNRAAEFCLILTLPAAIALLVIPEMITRVLFERGAFTPEDTSATAIAVAVYAFALPCFVLQRVLQPAFFAREDTKTPLRFAIYSMIINVVVAVGLMPVIGYIAAPVGTALAGVANLVLLWRGVRQMDPALSMDARLSGRIPRIAVASVLMGIVVLGLTEVALALPAVPHALSLAVIILSGMLVYAFAGVVLKAFHPSDVRDAMRRSPEGPR